MSAPWICGTCGDACFSEDVEEDEEYPDAPLAGHVNSQLKIYHVSSCCGGQLLPPKPEIDEEDD